MKKRQDLIDWGPKFRWYNLDKDMFVHVEI